PAWPSPPPARFVRRRDPRSSRTLARGRREKSLAIFLDARSIASEKPGAKGPSANRPKPPRRTRVTNARARPALLPKLVRDNTRRRSGLQRLVAALHDRLRPRRASKPIFLAGEPIRAVTSRTSGSIHSGFAGHEISPPLAKRHTSDAFCHIRATHATRG